MSFYEDASLIVLADGAYDGGIKAFKPVLNDSDPSNPNYLVPSGVGDFTVDRNSEATFINSSGERETAAVNIPRFDYSNGSCPELLVEPQSTNLFLNSDSLSSQVVVTGASNYTITFEGTGTITFSGSYVGSLVGVGDGYQNRVSLTFTATAGSLFCTVSGDVNFAQCENLDYATSYISSGLSTTTRLADEITGAGDSSTFNSSEGVLFAEINALSDNLTQRAISLSDGTTNNSVYLEYFNVSNRIRARLYSGGVLQATVQDTSVTITDFNKVAVRWGNGMLSLFVNNVNIQETAIASVPTGLDRLNLDLGQGSAKFYGRIKKTLTFNEALSDSQLEQL